MPQEMNVLCCYSCKMYQVHIVKKSNKWNCKICGEKQSIQVVYFQGSGIDCRLEVQHLNSLKAKQQSLSSTSIESIDVYGLDCTAESNDENGILDQCQCPKRSKKSNGKWSQFLDDSEKSETDESSDVYYHGINDTESSDSQSRSKSTIDRKDSQERSHSFAGFQNCSSNLDSSSRVKSRTYPLTNRSRKVLSKWNKYLDDSKKEEETESGNDFSKATSFVDKKSFGKWDNFLENSKDGKVSNVDADDEILTNDSTTSNQSTKCNIFEDYNDDLDLTIDF